MSGVTPKRSCAPGDPKTGHDLVEDQHRTGVGRQPAGGQQKVQIGNDAAHVADDRLQDDRGDLVAMLRESVF